METLTVWKVDSPDGARAALDLLERLQKEELLRLDDAATVTWPQGRRKAAHRAAPNITGTGALLGP